MSLASVNTRHADDLSTLCAAVVPLRPRLESWQIDLLAQPDLLAEWIDRHGSPLNVLDPAPFRRNLEELERTAAHCGIDLDVFFARKANKALVFVDEARDRGFGVDLASEGELDQALGRGVDPDRMVVTAAVKPAALLERCVSLGLTVVADNEDELCEIVHRAREAGRRASVGLRLAPRLGSQRPLSRFGFTLDACLRAVERYCPPNDDSVVAIAGVHFHVDGYSASDRIAAAEQSLVLVDALREQGHSPAFLDIGGGVPVSYLESREEWDRFWAEHRRALLGERAPITWDSYGLGFVADDGRIAGRANVYPYFQEQTRAGWLEEILTAVIDDTCAHRTIAAAVRRRGLELRCEPGRALLDGCGMTVARVVSRKERGDGTWLIGLDMNRTQCRSGSEEHLVDPLLIRPTKTSVPRRSTGPIEGYLMGSYCIERDLLSWRRLRFPSGVEDGDLVVFANTAGYLMHLLESRSHQNPLARNIVVGTGTEPNLDAIDLA